MATVGSANGSATAGAGAGIRRGINAIAERAVAKPSSTPWIACADSIVISTPPHCTLSRAFGVHAWNTAMSPSWSP